MTATTLTGLQLIAAERQRQIDAEGFDAGHDFTHPPDVLARAAACYASPAEYRLIDMRTELPYGWPFGAGSWKPTAGDRVRELVKAGALIVAELDAIAGRSSDSGA